MVFVTEGQGLVDIGDTAVDVLLDGHGDDV